MCKRTIERKSLRTSLQKPLAQTAVNLRFLAIAVSISVVSVAGAMLTHTETATAAERYDLREVKNHLRFNRTNCKTNSGCYGYDYTKKQPTLAETSGRCIDETGIIVDGSDEYAETDEIAWQTTQTSGPDDTGFTTVSTFSYKEILSTGAIDTVTEKVRTGPGGSLTTTTRTTRRSKASNATKTTGFCLSGGNPAFRKSAAE